MNSELQRRSALDIAREIWLPAAILSCAAIVLRLLVATRREGIEIDGITYLLNAQAMTGDWQAINLLHPPLYSMLLAVFHSFWSDAEWGARVVSAVVGGLWVWPALWLASETTTARVHWPAGLLVALFPSAVDASTRVLAESLFGLCLAVFLVGLIRTFKSQSWLAAGLSGVAGGLATLTRPEGMAYLPFVWGAAALTAVLCVRRDRRRRVMVAAGVVTAMWMLAVLPHAVAIKQQTGQWHWSGKVGVTLRWAESVGQERPQAFLEHVVQGTQDKELPRSIGGYVLAHPLESAQRAASNLYLMDKYVIPGLLHSGGLALVILGLVCLRPRPAADSWEWYLVASLLPLAGFLLFVVEVRYFVSAVPTLCIVAAIGLVRMRQIGQPAESGTGPSRMGVIVLVVVLVSFVPWLVRPWFRQDPSAVEKAAGLWLRQTEGRGAVLVGRYPRVAYYAEATAVPFSPRPLDGLLVEARKQGGRFLIADSVVLPNTRPDLLMLTAGFSGRTDLELIHVEEDRAGRRVAVYRIHAERK
jgi:4-amino-4-deoxy-L-arabinose transferase-like glycosyltransferase